MAESKVNIYSKTRFETKPSHKKLIATYSLSKAIIKWALLVFVLLGICYTILTARSEHTPQSVLSEGDIGQQLANNGKVVALAVTRDNMQEVVVSTDSGKTFLRTGDQWPARDSTLFVQIAQDSASVIALEKTGVLHVMRAGEDHFSVTRLTVPITDSSVYGFSLVPGTDSIYVFGAFPGVLALSWKSPGRQIQLLTPDERRVLALTVNQRHEIVALLQHPVYHTVGIFNGMSLAGLVYTGQYAFFEKHDSASQSFYSPNANSLPDTMLPVSDSTRKNSTLKK